MNFLLDLRTGIYGPRYRLQNDGGWRNLDDQSESFSPVIENDKLFSSLTQMNPYSEIKEITIDSNTYKVNPTETMMGDPTVAFYDPRVLRVTKPKLFTSDEMKGVIANGDDETTNVLVVNIGGEFKLLDFHQDKVGRKDFAPIAVRHEAYMAGNGYVGEAAAEDSGFMRQEYVCSLEGWLTHLRTGMLDIFVDTLGGQKTEEELIREITEIKSQFCLRLLYTL